MSYFPAAFEAKAAAPFVEKVIGKADKVQIKDGSGGGMAAARARRFRPVDAARHRQRAGRSRRPDIRIKTPAIQAIQARMESRFNGTLRAGFDSGALGFTSDGLISVRDAGKLELKDRVAMNAAVADDNRDRKAVAKSRWPMAIRNGKPDPRRVRQAVGG